MFDEVDRRRLITSEKGFSWKSSNYRYTDVTAIRRAWVHTRRKLYGLIDMGGYHDFDLWIFFKACKPLHMHVGSSTLATIAGMGDRAIDKCENFQQFVTFLYSVTKAGRAEKYLSSLQKGGYFDYEGARFFRDGRISKDRRKRTIKESILSRTPTSISFEGSKATFFERARAWLIGDKRDIHVITTIDTDIFYELLQKLYGIEWKKTTE